MNFFAWTGTAILPISASQVARITGVNHWHPPDTLFIHIYRDAFHPD
jgi:hypothetical protein